MKNKITLISSILCLLIGSYLICSKEEKEQVPFGDNMIPLPNNFKKVDESESIEYLIFKNKDITIYKADFIDENTNCDYELTVEISNNNIIDDFSLIEGNKCKN